jgi:pimeloyl-ACP methyl ester carboxylesterase
MGPGMPLPVLHGGPALGHNYLLPQTSQLAEHPKLILCDQRGTGTSGGRVDSASITMDNYSLRYRGRQVHSAGVGYSSVLFCREVDKELRLCNG